MYRINAVLTMNKHTCLHFNSHHLSHNKKCVQRAKNVMESFNFTNKRNLKFRNQQTKPQTRTTKHSEYF